MEYIKTTHNLGVVQGIPSHAPISHWLVHQIWGLNNWGQAHGLPPFSQEKQKKQNKAESVVKYCILIMDGQKVVKIKLELEINHS